MATVCEKNKCNGCMACIDKCPQNCISIVDNIYSYNAIKNPDRCVNCGLCEKVCPNNILVEKHKSVEWKQGWAELEIRAKSSSGGVASAITKSFIEMGGYVASCRFKNGKFGFDITNNYEVAKEFAGSKYVKSNPIGIYRKIQERLRTDKVLFIGLPCQVAGLKNFIKYHENLYTIDLICHGTPSPRLLEQFLSEYGYSLSKLAEISFRNELHFELKLDGIRKVEKERDCYLISYLNSINYTENCYSCNYATRERVSDLTLGDAWGTEYKSEARKGISLILIQSQKGKKLLESSNVEQREIDYDKAVKFNHQLMRPAILKPEREIFLKMIKEGKTIKQATRKTLPIEVLKQKVKFLINCFGMLRFMGR